MNPRISYLSPAGLTMQTQDDLESGRITIRVLDKGVFKDTLIGLYEFDLSYVYFKPYPKREH